MVSLTFVYQVSEVEVRSKKLMEERDRMEREAQRTHKEKQGMEKKCGFLSDKLGSVLRQLSEESEVSNFIIIMHESRLIYPFISCTRYSGENYP